jgi:hypothetical protein
MALLLVLQLIQMQRALLQQALPYSTNFDIIQTGGSKITFIGGLFNRTLTSIATPGNAIFNSSDAASDNATYIGKSADITQDIIVIGTGETTPPTLTYQHNYNGATGLVLINQTGDITVSGVEATANDARLSAVTLENTQAAGVQLYSGNIGSIPPSQTALNNNIRGWELVKAPTTANLQANFTNSDTIGSTTVTKYTSLYIDGFNNVLNFPAVTTTFLPTYTTTRLQWGQDTPISTNLYRAATSLLKTDANFAIGTLGASAAGFALTAATAGNVIQVSPTTATELGFVNGVTSPIQTQLNNKLSLSGGTLTGALTLPQGSSINPSLNFTGFPQTGLSATSGLLSLNTSGSPVVTINQTGNVTINGASSGTTLTVTGGGASISGNLTIQPGSGRIITDAITINNAPINGTDGTNKAYVDSVAVGLAVKTPCNLVDVLNTATSGFPIIDSVATTTSYRVLLTAENNCVLNGIWQINSGGSWSRPTDFPSGGSAANAYTLIQQGAVFANSSWICTNTIGNATIDTNSLNWTEFTSPQNITGANVGTEAGVFRDKTGSTLNFRSLNSPNSNIIVTQNTNDISIALSSSPSVVGLTASGAVVAGSFSDGAGVIISNGTITANSVLATTTLRAGAGSAAFPSIDFVGSPFTGFSAPTANTLNISTAGVSRLQIDPTGNITVQNNPQFPGTAGVVHNNAAGQLSSSLVVGTDIASNTIPNSALIQLTAANLVANSATSATPNDVASTIVQRDSSRNFAANNIYADTSFIATAGNATTPSITFGTYPSPSTGAGLSSPIAGQLNLISGTGLSQVTQIILNQAGNAIQLPILTPSLPLQLDASNNIVSLAIDLGSSQIKASSILPIGNGGTGVANTTNNAVLLSGVAAVTLTNGQILVGNSSNIPVAGSIQGTANRIIVNNNGAGTLTLSTPQDIATTSSPTFVSEILTNNLAVTSASNQITLGSGPTITLSAPNPAVSRIYFIPDVLGTSTFVMTSGNQTIAGNKTFSGTTNLSGLTASLPLQLDANKNIISAPISFTSFSGVLTVTQGGTNVTSLGTNSILASNSTGTAVIPLPLTAGQILIGTSGGGAPLAAQIQGTANEINVASTSGSIVLSTPQPIATTSSPTFVNVTANLTGTATFATNAGTSVSTTTAVFFTGALLGDVTGTQGATVVATVGGQTATSIANTVTTVNAATNLNTPNTLVKRDASGNFVASTITANLTGSATFATNAATSVSTTTAVFFTGALLGDVTGTQGATVVATVGGQTAANVAAATILANNATSADTPNQIVKRDASGNFAAGQISLLNPTNQLILGSGNNVTLSAQSLTQSYTYYFPNLAPIGTSTFVMVDGAQTIGGAKTFTAPTTFTNNVTLSNLTPSLPLQLNASNQIISAPLTPASFSGILTVSQGGTGSSSIGINSILSSNATGTAIIPLPLAAGQILIGTAIGSAPVAANITQASINQVIVANGPGTITLSTPQDIGTSSLVRFGQLTLNNNGSLIFGNVGPTTTISATQPSASRTYTIPDTGVNANFIMSAATGAGQTISSPLTLSGTVNLSALTASLPLQLDGSKNIISQGINLSTQVTNTLPIAFGGTNSGTALTNNKVIVSSNGQIVESAVTISQLNSLANATSSDIINTLVLRDNTGSFVTTNITLTGNLILQGQTGGALIVNTSGIVTATVGIDGTRLASFPLTDTPAVTFFQPVEPSRESYFFDDFLSFNTTAGDMFYGDTYWVIGNNTAGRVTAIPPLASNGAIGVTRLTSGAAALNSNYLTKQLTGTTSLSLSLGYGPCLNEWRVSVPAVSTGTNSFYTRVGFGDSPAATATNPTGAPSNGIFFQALDSINSGNWTINTASNGNRSSANTAVAPIAGTYQRLSFQVNGNATSVTFFINDISVGTITTNIPNVTGGNYCSPYASVVRNAGSGGSLDLDYWYFHYTFNTRR